MCRSVPQIPARRTRMRTSLMPNVGFGTSSSQRPGSRLLLTSAFMTIYDLIGTGGRVPEIDWQLTHRTLVLCQVSAAEQKTIYASTLLIHANQSESICIISGKVGANRILIGGTAIVGHAHTSHFQAVTPCGSSRARVSQWRRGKFRSPWRCIHVHFVARRRV